MILLDVIFTFIESFLICFVSFYIYGLKSKKKFVLVVLLCMLATLFFNYVYPSDFGVLFGVIFIIFFFISHELNGFKVGYFLMPLISYVLLTLINVLSMSIMSVVLKVDIIEINNQNPVLFIPTAILSRILFLGACYLDIIVNLKIKKQQLENRAIFAIISFLLSAVLLFLTLMSSILYQVFSIQILYEMIFFLFILCGSSVFAYLIMVKMNKQNVEMTRQLMNEQYQKELYFMTKRSTELITNDMHMMKYSLMKIQNDIKQNKINDTLEFVNNEIEKYMDYDKAVVTNNPIFDFELTVMKRKFRMNNTQFGMVICINANTILFKNVENIKRLIQFLEYIEQNITCSNVRFNLEEFDNYYKMKVIVDSRANFDSFIDLNYKDWMNIKTVYDNYVEYNFLMMKDKLL